MTPSGPGKSPEEAFQGAFSFIDGTPPCDYNPGQMRRRASAASHFSEITVRPREASARTFVAEGSMANTKSAKKKTRVIARRTEINQHRRSMMRGFIRKVEEAIAGGDRNVALAALKAAEPQIMRASQKGIVHKKAASRKVSRLTMRVAKLANA
jgi:small subunit ribosomal protein S20